MNKIEQGQRWRFEFDVNSAYLTWPDAAYLVKAFGGDGEEDILQHRRPVNPRINPEGWTVDQGSDVVRVLPDLEHGRMIVAWNQCDKMFKKPGRNLDNVS